MAKILPHTNLTDFGVRDELNAGGGVTDNQSGSKYKEAADINVWSFYKPYNFDSIISPTDEEIRGMNCGLKPYQIGAYNLLPEEMDGKMNGWEYDRPVGGEHSPFRIGDFRGYDDDAAPMIANFTIADKISYQSLSVSGTAIVMQQGGSSVSLADLGMMRGCHAAVYLKKANSTQSRMYWNQDRTITEAGTFDVTINPSDMGVGNWTAYPFLIDDSNGTIYYTIPNVSPKEIEVVESLDILNVQAQYRYSEEGLIVAVQYKYTLQNNSGGSTKNNYVYLTNAKDDLNVESAYGEYSIKLPDITTSSLKEYRYPYDYNGMEWAEISVNYFNPSYVNWVVVSIGTARIVQSVNIMQMVQPKL